MSETYPLFADPPPVFDAEQSEAAKETGMARAAEAQPGNLALARAIAKRICLTHGSVTADDVGEELARRGIDLGPAAGSIFASKEFVWTGERVRSKRKSNHARELRIWRLA